MAHDGNNFQWKINVPMRTSPHLLSSALPSARLTSCSARLLVCSSDPLFSSFSLLSFFLLFLPSLICSALPALCSARWGGGAYPFAEKSPLSFLPPKIPAIFSKTSPYPIHASPTYLTPNITRTVSHKTSYPYNCQHLKHHIPRTVAHLTHH